MAVGIHLFTQEADDLECGHKVRWAGALEGPLGEHLIALECATCVPRVIARDMLNEFALYVRFAFARMNKMAPQTNTRSATS